MITSGDFLAGGGGVTHAMTKIKNMKVIWVLNHSKVAIRTNMFNHRGIKHYWVDFYKQDEHEMEPVDFVWASIECTQFSIAKGNNEKNIGSYMLAWELKRYIKYLQPFIIGIENVIEFKKWAPLRCFPDKNKSTKNYSALLFKNGQIYYQPDKNKKGQEFEKWKRAICALGYEYHENILNAADYGIPTRRKRYFAFFTRIELGIKINWPKPTHNKDGLNGLKKWKPCRDYIDMTNEGESIFGRSFNPNIRKNKRYPLSYNTLKRIACGIKKFVPELYFIFQYYSSGTFHQSINTPLRTITVKDRHVLVKLEKKQFIQDYCRQDIYNNLDNPISPQLTWQTKQLISINKKQFLSDYYGRENTAHSLDGPSNTITTENSKHLISAFLSNQYNSNGKPEVNNQSLDSPCGSLTTNEKVQFITTYFTSSDNPGSQNQSLDSPLGTILTGLNKKALITVIEKGEFDFDIKMRFLSPDELARISTFPEKYFTNPLLKLTKKEQVKLIGNAVPPEWAKLIIEPVIKELEQVLSQKKIAV